MSLEIICLLLPMIQVAKGFIQKRYDSSISRIEKTRKFLLSSIKKVSFHVDLIYFLSLLLLVISFILD
jgi:hypothetical protein